MKYLMCYDVHNSRGDAGVYADINRAMEEKFEVLVKCTESVYLFEAGAMDLDRLKESIRVKLHFVPDLDFHVFRLEDELDKEARLKYYRAIFDRLSNYP